MRLSKWRVFSVVVLLLAIPAAVILVSRQQRLKSRAIGSGQAEFSFSAPAGTMPPNQTLSLKLDSADKGVIFLRADVVFDPAKVKLTGEVTTTNLLKTKMTVTNMADANSSGRLTIMLGLTAEDVGNPPHGQFEVAQIPIEAVSSAANDTATWRVDAGHTEAVNISDSQDLQIVTVPLVLTLNPNGEPTNTSAPEPSVPVPTPTPNGGVGGEVIPNSCGGTCGSEVNCLPGLTCYMGYCRNPNNPGNTNCSDKTAPNGCDGTCGSEVNCLPGLICYQGRCRNPDYPTSKLCVFEPSSTPIPSPTPRPRPTAIPKLEQPEPKATSWPTPTLVPAVVPEPTPVVYSQADVNYDKCVNWEDVRLVLGGWIKGGDSQIQDVSGDGKVDMKDVWFVIARLGEGCNVK